MKNEKVSDFRIICYGEHVVQKITPKSGDNAGKEVTVLTIRGFHPVNIRKDDGTFEEQDPKWFDLKLFDNNAELLSTFFKDGIVLRVSGEIKDKVWTGKDGKERNSSEITLYSVAIDIKQKGLKGIMFEKPIKQK